MANSMTAFARQAASGTWGSAVWEIRSVNNRYLDITLRLPDDLRGLESALREQISRRLKRGKIDCSLKFQSSTQQGALEINLDQVKQLSAASQQITELFLNSTAANPLDILNWPGVITKQGLDLETTGKTIRNLMDQTLDTLVETRQREGEQLTALIETRCSACAEQVADIRQQMPDIIRSINKKLHERVAELASNIDEVRLEQEIAILVQKTDVDEELDRLDAHIIEVSRVIKQTEPIGRRLDFLMQEMNREANTLGSKSAHMASTDASIELKVLIEQMREQIQNIE